MSLSTRQGRATSRVGRASEAQCNQRDTHRESGLLGVAERGAEFGQSRGARHVFGRERVLEQLGHLRQQLQLLAAHRRRQHEAAGQARAHRLRKQRVDGAGVVLHDQRPATSGQRSATSDQ